MGFWRAIKALFKYKLVKNEKYLSMKNMIIEYKGSHCSPICIAYITDVQINNMKAYFDREDVVYNTRQEGMNYYFTI